MKAETRSLGSWAHRVGLAVLTTLSLCVLVAPTASADCVGFGSEAERIAFSRDRAAIAAIATPTAVETSPRPPSGGAPVAVYTFTIDTALDGVRQEGIAVVPLEEGREPTYCRICWRAGDENPALREVLRASEEALPTPPGTPD